MTQCLALLTKFLVVVFSDKKATLRLTFSIIFLYLFSSVLIYKYGCFESLVDSQASGPAKFVSILNKVENNHTWIVLGKLTNRLN